MDTSAFLLILLGAGFALAPFTLSAAMRAHAARKAQTAKQTEQAIAAADHDLVGAFVAYMRLREPDFPINKGSCLRISRHKTQGWPRIIADMGTWGRTTPIHPPAAVQDLLLTMYRGLLEQSLGKQRADRIVASNELHRRPPLRALTRHDLVKYHLHAQRLEACHQEADLRSPYGATGFGYQR